MKKISLNFNKKKFEITLKLCNCLEKFWGLMFSKREKAQALLFSFGKPVRLKIHSFFVFFPFIAIWLDNKNNVVDKKVIKPFRFSISPKKPFYKLIEIPINKKYTSIVKLLVGDSKV